MCTLLPVVHTAHSTEADHAALNALNLALQYCVGERRCVKHPWQLLFLVDEGLVHIGTTLSKRGKATRAVELAPSVMAQECLYVV